MKRLMAICLILLLLCGCSQKEPDGGTGVSSTIYYLDTAAQMQFLGSDEAAALEQVGKLLNALEEKWSATNADSLLASLDTPYAEELTDEDQALLRQARTLHQRTGGAFDPQLGALTELWGFSTGSYRVPSRGEIDNALQQPRWDLSGILIGYAGSQAVETLSQLDISCGLINFGGSVQTYGSKPDGTPWTVAIRDPAAVDGQAGMISVNGTVSVMTAGGYLRYFEEENGTRYHHILDPKTGYPAQTDLASVTVISSDGVTADALATALCVMGFHEAVRFWQDSDDFEAVFIMNDGTIYATSGVRLSECEFGIITRGE